jgi:hypothetical protein
MIDTSGLPFAKPCKNKACLDMRELPLGKTNRKQRIDKQARKVKPEEENCICWIPGCTKKAQKGYHHVVQVGNLVIDHKLNYLRPCPEHHNDCDEERISQLDQLEIVADHNNTTVENILNVLSEFSGHLLYLEGETVIVQKPVLQRLKAIP